jgi:hypothetical protein
VLPKTVAAISKSLTLTAAPGPFATSSPAKAATSTCTAKAAPDTAELHGLPRDGKVQRIHRVIRSEVILEPQARWPDIPETPDTARPYAVYHLGATARNANP